MSSARLGLMVVMLFTLACAARQKAPPTVSQGDIRQWIVEAEAASEKKQWGRAAALNQRAATQAAYLEDAYLESTALNELALVLHKMHMNQRAQEAITEAVEKRLASERPEEIHILRYNQAQIHWAMGNLGHAEAAFEVACKAPDALLALESYWWLSELQRESGLYHDMLETCLKAVVLAGKSQAYYSQSMAQAKTQFAIALANTDQVDEALEVFAEVLTLWHALDAIHMVEAGQAAYNYGLLAHRIGRPELAEEVLALALLYADTLQDEESILRIEMALDDLVILR